MFVMLHIHVFGVAVLLWFHCGLTGARPWNRSAFLMGLAKGICFLSESLYKYGGNTRWVL